MSGPFHGYRVAAVAALAFTATAAGQTFWVSQLNGPLRSELGLSETALATLGWVNGAKTVAVFTLWALFPPAVLASIEAFARLRHLTAPRVLHLPPR